MSEIAKCPICGGKPLDKWEVTSARVFQTGQMCCGVDCSTNERWNQYAAAMECQAHHNALREAVAWERECERVERKVRGASTPSYGALAWASDNLTKARAEVDRLIANADDCEGEG